jgi:hypothetical protein
VSGLIAYDSTANKAKLGANSATKVLATEDGNVATASALAANGGNCTSGQFPKGIDASGAAESCAALASSDMPAVMRKRSFGAAFDGGGAVLTAGVKSVPMQIPYACTISAWSISVDAGTATAKVWKVATGTAIPTVSKAISTGTHVRSTTVSDFTTTAVAANDVYIITLTAVATATQASVLVECDQ